MVDTQLKRYWLLVRAYRMGHDCYLSALKVMARDKESKGGKLAAAFLEELDAA